MDSNNPLGIKITPPVVEFIDAESEVVHQMKINVQNLSKTSKHIRFSAPSTKNFRIQCREFEKTVAPGLELSAFVEYYNDKDEDCEDCVIFMIDDNFIEVPLFSYAPKSTLLISGSVDFGTTVADGQIVTKEISILNHGTKRGDYRIHLEDGCPFHVVPLEGTIRPGYSQPVRFEFISKNIGNIEENLRVEIRGQSKEFITVKANVVPRALVLLSKDKQKHIDCIKFGSTYYGTDVVHDYWLYNASPEQTKFVVILDDGGKGQEVGIDTTKSVADICMQPIKSPHGTNLSSLISTMPCEGNLMPYEKRLIYFKFSPRFVKDSKGWKHGEKPPPRQDYAFFVKIQMVGIVGSVSDMKVEVALTGTVLPIFLSILPCADINFEDCKVGDKKESVMKLRNDSPDLPIWYAVKKAPHFHAYPACGYINASEIKELYVLFQPNQIGNFEHDLSLDIIGQICEMKNTVQPLYKKVVIQTHSIHVSGVSPSLNGKKHVLSHSATYIQSARRNMLDEEFDFYQSKTNTSLQVFNSKETYAYNSFSTIKECQTNSDKLPVKMAHPDDRATSIRPSDRNQIIRTKFTKKNRYTYVDPDYSFTDGQKEEVEAHKKKYTSFLRDGKLRRKQKENAIEFQKINNDVDLWMKPAQGLKPPKLTVNDIKSAQKQKKDSSNKTNEEHLLSSKLIVSNRESAFNKKAVEGLKAVPSTSAEKSDCKAVLKPQELFMIFFEPQSLDFGDVCSLSMCAKELKIANNITKTILVEVQLNCMELRQTSPLSQVIPPGSVAKLQVIFESSILGKFERSINYIINGHHKSHLIIHANVVTVNLELSSTQLLLTPTHGMPAEAGYRKCVTLKNERNMAAEFTWSPIVTKDGTSFTIRPAKGVVEAFSVLDCEVTFYPSFSASFTGEFVARVEGGNDLRLFCTAQAGITSCAFVERRLMFGAVPLNMTTLRSAFLKNTSNNHAYFKVVDATPIQGMFISPKEGVVPVGGTAELMMCCKPCLVQKFDTEVQVDVRGWKTILLRMGGHVEPPSVDVDVDSFVFGGIVGSATASIPFRLMNLGQSKVHIVFDLTMYQDFKVIFPGRKQEHNGGKSGCFQIMANEKEIVNAVLQFTPSEVASYDFILPVCVNHIMAPTPPPSPYPASVAATRSVRTFSAAAHLDSSPSVFEFITPRRRVEATGLRSPLQLSSKKIEFNLPSGFFDLHIADSSGRIQSIILVNNGREKLSWSFDIDSCKQLFKNGVFSFLFKHGSMSRNDFANNYTTIELQSGEMYELKVAFNPIQPGEFKVSVPLILNNEKTQPYGVLDIVGILQSTNVHFDPGMIVFNTVPLETEVKAIFKIIGKGFQKDAHVLANIPSPELEDGSCLDVFKISFLDGDIMHHCAVDMGMRESCTLTCELSFKSSKPVAYFGDIVFDIGCESFTLPVTATADNCLLTTYSFLSNTQNDFHIVCERVKEKEDGSDIPAGAVFVPCVSPIRAPTAASMVTNSTSFGLHTSSYEDSTISSLSSPSTLTTPPAPSTEDAFVLYQYEGVNLPESSSGEDKHLEDVMRIVQRWYSSQCWSKGHCVLTLPYSLRRCYSTNVHKQTKTRAGSWNREETKESRTIIDIVVHLCGKAIPGIPLNTTLPADKDNKIDRIIWLYSTLLTFLRCQGAMVASIKPEFLLDSEDYYYFLNMDHEGKTTQSVTKSLHHQREFESLSRKAWTDLLLQIIKVLVLARVTPTSFKKMVLPAGYPTLPVFNPDPYCSNVYSVNERIILAWLNHNYEQQRVKCWKSIFNVPEPASRWIVNFDNDFVDGLVLASLIAAYCPYLTRSHLHSMYTHPSSAEQCLHNALKVVDTIRFIGLDFDVLATDITEPNSVNMLLLSVYLYRRLSQYIPKSTIEMTGSLHSVVTKHVKLQNPSTKPLVYQTIIAGDYMKHFNLPTGTQIQVPPKGHVELPVEYRSHFLRPCVGTLILVGRRVGSAVGSTLVFTLKCLVDTILPVDTVRCISPCYEFKKIYINVTNPFLYSGSFKVALVETSPTDNSSLSKKSKQKKFIPSKTIHGQSKRVTSPKKAPVNAMLKGLVPKNNKPLLSAFWTPINEIRLDVGKSKEVEIHFLPFEVGTRQCSILFLNKDIGEFLYSVEAESSLPLPSEVPFKRSHNGLRVTSAMAVHHSQGFLKEDNTVIYLHCEAGTECLEELQLPVVNAAKDRALVIATQQRMSKREFKRRELTGITSSETILSAVSSLQINEAVGYSHPADVLGITGPLQMFTVEVTSPYFKVPSTICAPIADATESDKETVKLPLTVLPCKPGQYSCKVIMKSLNDIRIYHIECTVKHTDVTVELEFTSPTHQAILQNVPIVNHSDTDWILQVEIRGDGFIGPSFFTATADNTTHYPLSFKPVFEGQVEGQVTMRNRSNGAESIFIVRGLGTKSLPLDTVQIDCIVNETTMKVVDITNDLNHKMVFQTFSDLDMITGAAFITVLPKQTVHVPITVQTKKRGLFAGMLMFVYDAEYVEKMGLGRTIDADSDDEADDIQNQSTPSSNTFISCKASRFAELSESNNFKKPYRIWYSFHVNSIPSPPEKRLEIKTAIRTTATVELLLKNPLDEDLVLDVVIEGAELYGEPSVTIQPHSSFLYQVQYTPTVICKMDASVIFHGASTVEFWYELQLVAEQPFAQTLPIMQCALGKSCSQAVCLHNPTVEPVVYSMKCSNPNNFSVDCSANQSEDITNQAGAIWVDDFVVSLCRCFNDVITNRHLIVMCRLILVPPLSELEVGVTFTPSDLGSVNHQAELIFENALAGTEKFSVTGIGERPDVNTGHVIHSGLGKNTTTIINFHNPFDRDVIIDVDLHERPLLPVSNLHVKEQKTEVYTLLLKAPNSLILPPKCVLDIPISYSPDTMQKRDAVCAITARHFNMHADNNEPIFDNNDVTWRYEIQGVPLSVPVKVTHAPVLECRARERLEEKLEISLVGVDTDVSKSANAALLKFTSAMRLLGQSVRPRTSELDEEYATISEDFKCELKYEDVDGETEISRSVAFQLRRKLRHKITGVITLLFEIILAPARTFNHVVYLSITSSQGGVWKYPLRLISTEPVADDVITIQSAGLNKDSTVAFRLTSQCSEECQYEAFFANGSDPVFTISPSSGMLSPVDSDGSLLTISYRPTYYGRTHQAKLLIQTRDTQWIYDIKGVTPVYEPPRVNAATGSYFNGRITQTRKKNFVRQNLRLVHTGVSSPLKGDSLVQKRDTKSF